MAIERTQWKWSFLSQPRRADNARCSGCLPLCHFVHFKWLGMVVLILIIPVLFFWIPLIFELYVNLPSGSRRFC